VRNSGELADWNAHVVHERDTWDYEEGDNPHIYHRPVRGDRGAVIAAYSVARFRTGELSREWMWIEELDKVRATSKAKAGPWQDWTDEMYKKTVAKRHSKVLPMSSDLDDLLRRPDEPETSGADQSGGVTLPAVERQPPPPAALSEALDALTSNFSQIASKPVKSDADNFDDDTGEVIDAGEYADSDHEQLPAEEKPRKTGTEP
jgi:recombination protein RecT